MRKGDRVVTELRAVVRLQIPRFSTLTDHNLAKEDHAKSHLLAAADAGGYSDQQALADVDLVTIPRREGTQLTIYNSEDITMVREHRC